LRILVVSDRYPPLSIGGYEIACHAVTERLRARGHDVRVLTSSYGLPRPRIDGHVARVLHRFQDTPSLARLGALEIADRREVRGAARWRPDAVYAWNLRQLFPSLHVLLGALGAPLVYNIQDIWIPGHLEEAEEQRAVWLRPGSSPVKAAAKTVLRRFLSLRDPGWLSRIAPGDLDLRHVVFCSRFRQREHVARGLPLGESVVIPNGVDRGLFGSAPRDPHDGLRLLFVGRLVQTKGAHIAIEALRHLVDRGRSGVELTLVGLSAHPFEYEASLRARVEALGLGGRITWQAGAPHAELPALYRRHDVLLFPSIGDEGLPVAMLEAMASGLAVIGTTTGGSAEILADGETGLVFPPGDAAALAAAVERLLLRPEERQALALAGTRLVAERFDLETIADQTSEHLASIAAR
jgi:glycogen(starch) synthase